MKRNLTKAYHYKALLKTKRIFKHQECAVEHKHNKLDGRIMKK